MADVASDDRPLVFEDLVGWMAEGGKPAKAWRVGAEHEKFVYRLADNSPVPYEPGGIKALLTGLTRFGWTPVMEGEHIIALERGMANVSLEPGGQFELSGAPLETIHDICEETGNHLTEVKQVADELGLGFLGLGYTPIWRRNQVPVMPKGRYKIMREYMPKVGNLGLDMMFRTCTVQANLDFADEADMVAKFRTSLALQPICTALFANSPFIEGKPSGFVSARANVWTDTDPDRTGMLDFVFREGFNFETYARYALKVPMYFVKRGDRYIDVAGRSFVDFMEGNHGLVARLANNGWLKFSTVNLAGIESLTLHLTPHAVSSLELRAGSPQGPLVAKTELPETTNDFREVTIPVTDPGGVNDLFFIARARTPQKSGVLDLNWVQFNKAPPPTPP